MVDLKKIFAPNLPVRDRLVAAVNFREFLILVLPVVNQNQAAISRRAGFSSRSYFSEILSGKKGLSKDSLARLKTALRLPKLWAQFFDYLVFSEYPKLGPTSLTGEKIATRLQQLRKDLTQQPAEPDISRVLAYVHRPQVFQVYAALGDISLGASLNEIMQRTGLSQQAVHRALSQLLEFKAAEQKGDRFFAFASQADALNLNQPGALAEMLGTVCSDLQKNKDKIVSVPTNLTVYSAFSVQKEQLPLLKQRLQEAVFDVLDEFQVDRGNQVQQIFLSLHGKPMELLDG